MNRIFTSLSLGIITLTTACSAATPRTVSQVWPLYRPADAARAGGGRDTYVVVLGNPLNIDSKQFEQLVINNMQGQNWGPPTNFSTQPADFDSAYKVVMLFNGVNLNAGQLCSNPGFAALSDKPIAELHVQAAYCRYDQMMTTSEGWLKADGDGISVEALGRLVRQITSDLFPPYNKGTRHRGGHLRR